MRCEPMPGNILYIWAIVIYGSNLGSSLLSQHARSIAHDARSTCHHWPTSECAPLLEVLPAGMQCALRL